MSRFVLIAASVTLLAVLPAHAATGFPVAKDGTTNIADCGKAPPAVRNECISRARPLTGKQIYAQEASKKAAEAKQEALASAKAAKTAKVAKIAAMKAAKVKAPVPAKVVDAPKGFKIDKDGTTNIADCAKAVPAVRNECISRSRPLTGRELAKFEKSRAVPAPVVAAKTVTKPVAVKQVAAVAPAPVLGKGFKIAKDGTTDIADCAKANPDFRNECISRARPIKGKEIYASAKPKS